MSTEIKVKSSTTNLMVRSLIDSLSIDLMKLLARKMIDGYDIHRRTGIQESIPIQKNIAAQQIVRDIIEKNLFPHFMSLLVDIHYNGYMGRKHPIQNINILVTEIQNYGFVYDKINRLFVEDPEVRISRNWGVLMEGEEYIFTFLRLDIVGNTKLVKKYPNDVIQNTYRDLHSIVDKAIIRRHGRIWNWEGDGGLVAFHFSRRNLLAVLSAMEIANRIFIYNKLSCRLDQPLEVRIAVHTGPCEYTDNEEDLKKSETVKKIIEIESMNTRPNTVTISDITGINLDQILTQNLGLLDIDSRKKYMKYELIMEN